MTTEIRKELTSIENTTEVTSEQALLWNKRVEVQRSEIMMLESLKENTDFDALSRNFRGQLKNDKNKINQTEATQTQ